MKTAIKTILFVTLLLSSQALNLRRSAASPIEQLKKFGEESNLQKNIINSVLLHLQTGGQVDDVITFIRQAIADTQSDYNNLVTESETEFARLDTLISGLNVDISDMNRDLSDTILSIQSLHTDVGSLDERTTNLQAELDALDEREQRINEAKNNDVLAFAQRQLRDSAAVQALGSIVPQLQALMVQPESGESFLEKSKESINAELAKIPLSKPILALVQMSTTFNAAKLQIVIEKLSTIKAGIEANQAKDAQQQTESETRYTALLNELSELRSSKAQSLLQAKGEKTSKEGQLTLAQAKKGQLEGNIESTTELLNSTVETSTSTHNSYERRINEASGAVSGLQTVLAILEDGADSLRDREAVTDALASNF